MRLSHVKIIKFEYAYESNSKNLDSVRKRGNLCEFTYIQ